MVNLFCYWLMEIPLGVILWRPSGWPEVIPGR